MVSLINARIERLCSMLYDRIMNDDLTALAWLLDAIITLDASRIFSLASAPSLMR